MKSSKVRNFPGTPNPWYFLKVLPVQMRGILPVQIGGLLRYKEEAYCGVSLSSRLGSQRGTVLQMGGVLRYKLEVYCQYFSDKLYGLGALEQCPKRISTTTSVKKSGFQARQATNLESESCLNTVSVRAIYWGRVE